MAWTRLTARILALALLVPLPTQAAEYPWLARRARARTVEQAFPPPPGFQRIALDGKGFGAWLRGLPLLPPGTPVRLFDGTLKGNQEAHLAVVDLDVGKQDLQQCADAIIRLRAEYLWSANRPRDIGFHRTDGKFLQWPGGDRAAFARYLRGVFVYAGTLSLGKQLPKLPKGAVLEPGDVLVRGGSPGHAVLVLDAADDAKGNRVVLIGQSFMPAQQFQVLKNPENPKLSPWYRAAAIQEPTGLLTPEWYPFSQDHVRRFGAPGRGAK